MFKVKNDFLQGKLLLEKKYLLKYKQNLKVQEI